VESADPPGGRRFRLTTARGCRAELAAVYADARNNTGKIDWADAARAASVLQILTKMIEGGEIESRLEALETAYAGRQPARRNGGYHAARP
jgi:hypothetical protein